jgi:hypothetical protein
VSLGAAVAGGFVCSAIARAATLAKVLAALVVVLGLASALPEARWREELERVYG